MAGITGGFVPGLLHADLHYPPLSVELGWLTPAEYAPRGYDLRDGPGAAGHIGPPKVPDALRWPISGALMPSFADDYYDRIHVLPRRIALGNLATEQVRVISIWNAWRYQSRTLQSLDLPSGSGMSITTPEPLPMLLRPMRDIDVELRVATGGSPVIDTVLVVGIAGLDGIPITITGSRAVVFGFAPNWAAGLRERIAFATAVQRFPEGEQRIALRELPRWQWEWEVAAGGDEARALDAALWGWQARPFTVPMWQYMQRLAAGVHVGDTLIDCDTDGMPVVAGGVVVLRTAWNRSEVVEVAEVLPGRIRAARPLLADWPAGTQLIPARFAQLDATVPAHSPASAATVATLLWHAVDDPPPPPSPAWPNYQGLPVDLRRPNWSEPQKREWKRWIEEFDAETGPVVRDDVSGRPEPTRALNYMLRNHAATAELVAEHHQRRGGWRAFWQPSGRADVRVVDAIAPAATVLRIAHMEAARFLAGDAGRGHLCLLHADGTLYFRQVESVAVTVDGTAELIVLADAIGRAVAADQWRRVCWLEKVVAEGDALEILHHTRDVASATMTVRKVDA